MNKTIHALLLAFLFCAAPVLAGDGLITVRSQHDVKTTADRLESALREKGMTVFIRIDHAQGAQGVGKELRPTELVIFGNPKVGTPLMQESQTTGIDLPQKALIWEDAAGDVWFTYNDPAYLAGRHHVKDCDEALRKIATALGNFSSAATR